MLEQWQPTSIELSDKLTLLPVARWARRNGVGSVLLSHERLGDMLALRTGLDATSKVSIGLLNRLLVRSVDTVVVTSDYARDEFQQVADAAGCPVVRVPLGVDLATFRPHPRGPGAGAAAGPRRPPVAGEEPAPRGRHGRRAAPTRRTRCGWTSTASARTATSWSSSPATRRSASAGTSTRPPA